MPREFYHGKIPIITKNLSEGVLGNPVPVRGGCVERDYGVDPVLMGDSPDGMDLYEESEWDAVFDQQERDESSLEHIYLEGGKPAFPLLDQNGHGYCWSYSTGTAIMLDRLKRNYPPIRINPHATAAIIKNGRDEGGWCGLSGKFGREHGYAVEGTGEGQWPIHSRDLRWDTPALRSEMAKHKLDESWYDFGREMWDQTLSKKQLATCGFSNVPCAADFMRFSHSMCVLRVVRIERDSWGPLVLQSWRTWGYHGLGVLREMWPDNAIGIRSTTPSAA